MAEGTPRAMTDDELASLLAAQERQAVGYYTSDIAEGQAKALDYYYGEPFGDEQAGRSQVVDRTVAVVIDNALAALLKPFVSSDESVSFQPQGPEDEAVAQQATEYVNYIFHCDNSGFQITHDWFKAALLEKLGVVKAFWQDTTAEKRHELNGLDARQLEEVVRSETVVDGPFEDEDGFYSVTVARNYADGRVKIEHIPSEEFRISPYARSLGDAAYIAHVTTKTRSDLIDMGFDPGVVESLSKWAETTDDARSDSRYRDEDFGGERAGLMTDRSNDRIAIAHEFPLVDYDGDGIAERREVIRAGDVILYNGEADDHPFAALCPVPMPHKVYGLSMADQVMDLQRIQSVLWRQMLDNLYLANNPRPVLPEAAERTDGTTQEDIETSAPGAVIRTAGAFSDLGTYTVPFFAEKALVGLQYAEAQQEARTGVTRIGQGLGADVLKKQEQTAGGLALVEQAQNTRVEMVARIFAETGVKDLFRKILRLVVTHQPRERVIRLRGQWVPVDPRGWNADMDVTIAVGLGVGSRMEQAAGAQQALQVMGEVAQTPYGAMVKDTGVHKVLKKLFNALGFKNTDDMLEEPTEGAPKQPPPDPKMAEVEAKMQIEGAKLQMEQQKAEAELQQSQAEGAMKVELAREQAAAQIELARAKAAEEASLARDKMRFEMEMARERMAFDQEIERERVRHDAAAKMEAAKGLSKNRPGGDLSE